ncbi:MarR family winged helix-turn-helix transcriptional regulator [Aestuariimicrobium soli]|uniref:MarR family winged helix-turn-helix transcriptional regulator n=1 Tax=Aestuariimicrobium soli TaxID=2035834 RepID=UPI003EBA6969
MVGEVRWLDDEQQRVWRLWLHGSARVNDRLDAQLRSVGLDLGDYEILVSLVEGDDRERRMSDLAEMVHQSRSRLTHAIKRMEANGWVARRPAPDDRRGVIATLTDEGFALLERAAPGHVQAVREILVDPVEPDDYAALGRAMAAVLAVPD